MVELYTIFVFGFLFIALLIIILCFISKRCFDDTDPDMFWYDNYAAPKPGLNTKTPLLKPLCEHKNRSDVVVWATATCEQVHTICHDCSETLEIKPVEC